jgi:AhpD family alkylhydroperoxidase
MTDTGEIVRQYELDESGGNAGLAAWSAMSGWPEYLERNWQRTQAILERGRLTALDKQIVGLAVSVVSGCQSCVERQVGAVTRWRKSDQAITELLALAEHTGGLCCLVGALQVEPDLEREIPAELACLIGLPHGDDLDEPTRATLAEIRVVEAELSGVDRVPNLWRALSLNPGYLKTTWDKHQLVMGVGNGELSIRQKQMAALGVAMRLACRYLIQRFIRTLLRAGLSRGDIREIAAVVDHQSCLCTVASAMTARPG